MNISVRYMWNGQAMIHLCVITVSFTDVRFVCPYKRTLSGAELVVFVRTEALESIGIKIKGKITAP